MEIFCYDNEFEFYHALAVFRRLGLAVKVQLDELTIIAPRGLTMYEFDQVTAPFAR